MGVDGYNVTYLGIHRHTTYTESGSSVTTDALLRVRGRENLTLTTGQINSTALGISRVVGVRTDWLRAQDLYTILDSVQGKTAFIIVEIEPLVNLIWLAGYLFLAGALVAMWPDAREQRRLVTRLSLA